MSAIPDIAQQSSNPYPVEPAGFFIGSLLACGLYGVHTSQIYTYFDKYRSYPPLSHRLLVVWVWAISTLHMLIVWSAGYHYYVTGIRDPSVWGEFWWPLSGQDGVIPLMAATAQAYFGRRAWLLTGKRRWVAITFTVLISITMAFGVALAVTARYWSDNPWVSVLEMHSRPIGVPSQAMAIAWMGLTAITDASITFILVWKFREARRLSTLWTTRHLAKRLIALTLETVLLTHIVGAVMCVIFLASPAQHRTKNDLFWVLLEIITELYALSILFTIIGHETVRKTFKLNQPVDDTTVITQEKDDIAELGLGQTELDHRVEGYQGSPMAQYRSAFDPDTAPGSGRGSSHDPLTRYTSASDPNSSSGNGRESGGSSGLYPSPIIVNASGNGNDYAEESSQRSDSISSK